MPAWPPPMISVSICSIVAAPGCCSVDQLFAGVPFGPRGFDVRFCHLQTVPAPLRNAMSDCPRDEFSVRGRKLVEELPRTRNLASACQVAVQCSRRRRFDRHFRVSITADVRTYIIQRSSGMLLIAPLRRFVLGNCIAGSPARGTTRWIPGRGAALRSR